MSKNNPLYRTGIILVTMISIPLLLGTALFAAENAAKSGMAPRLDIPNDYWYFGFVPANEIIQHVFWIKNSGNDSLRIFKVKPTCGCTTAPLDKDVIAPGDSSKLGIIFDNKNMFGRMVKEVSILSNDMQKPDASVKFFAVIRSEHEFVKVKPNELRFSMMGTDKSLLKRTLEVSNSSASDYDVSVKDFPLANFKIAPMTQKLKAGSKVTFEVEQTSPVTIERDILSSMTIEFAGKDTDRITIPLVCYFKK